MLTCGGLLLGLSIWGAIESCPFECFWKPVLILSLTIGLSLLLIGVAIFGSEKTVQQWMPRIPSGEKTIFVFVLVILSLPVLTVWTLIKGLRKK